MTLPALGGTRAWGQHRARLEGVSREPKCPQLLIKCTNAEMSAPFPEAGTARDREMLCCAAPTNQRPPVPAPLPQSKSQRSPCHQHVPGQDLPPGWSCSAEHVRTRSDTEWWGHGQTQPKQGDRAQGVTSQLRGGRGTAWQALGGAGSGLSTASPGWAGIPAQGSGADRDREGSGSAQEPSSSSQTGHESFSAGTPG